MAKRWNPPKGETIVAWAQRAKGPGWANAPVWVITRDGNQHLHEHCIQPEQQGAGLLALYNISEAVHRATVAAIKETV